MKPNVTKQTIQLYWQHLSKYKLKSTFITTMVVAAVISGQFLVPLIAANILDKLSQGNVSEFSLINDFGPYLIALALLLLIELVLWRVSIFYFWTLQGNIMKQLSERCFNFLMYQSHRFHSDNFGGSLISQSNKFVKAFERIIDETLFSIVTIITAYFATIIILLPRAPQYVFVFTIVSLSYIAVLIWRTKKAHPYNIREATSESRQTAQLADSITNVETIKPFANEELEGQLYERKTRDVLNKTLATRNIITVNEIMFTMFNATLYFIAIVFAIISVTVYNANLGTVLLITSYTSNLLRRFWELQQVMRTLTRGFGDAHDMTNLLQESPEIKDPAKPLNFSSIRGDIKFSNVTFAYPENPNKPLFNNLDLHIKPGEKIGLVGHSGGGKSTITKLILRLMDINKGSISIDGYDISKVKQNDLRQKIAYVPQEPLMFHRTLTENIRYGQLNASEEEVKAAAKMANADEFIEGLNKGYDTLVGERGTKLSGGQRQRIAIARAMLKNAPILLLDEATSALDSESEQLVQDALWKLMEGRTAIIIAHRLSTIQKMDRILVIDNGKVVEQGTHKELIRQNGTYASLWQHQTGGFLED